MPTYLLLSETAADLGTIQQTFTRGTSPEDARNRLPPGHDLFAVVDIGGSDLSLDQHRSQILEDEALIQGKVIEHPRCPFCGGKARVQSPQGYFDHDGVWHESDGWKLRYVVCWKCEAAGPSGYGAKDAIREWANRLL